MMIRRFNGAHYTNNRKGFKNALSTERIKQQLSKLGNTIYHLDKITIDFCDNGIIPIKSLNDLRRELSHSFNKRN